MQDAGLDMQLPCVNGVAKWRLLSLQVVLLPLPNRFFHLLVTVNTPVRKTLLQGDIIY